jgi:hypothetical protein
MITTQVSDEIEEMNKGAQGLKVQEMGGSGISEV